MKMTVACTCTGEGLGHAARTVAIVHMLRSRHRVVVFCPVHLFPFMRKNLGTDVVLEEIPFFSLAKNRERIDYAGTVVENLPRAARFPADVLRVARRLRHHRVQALISDYEPYGAYAAQKLGVPVLQINHPAVVLRRNDASVPSLAAKAVSVFLMGPYHRKMVVSFYDGDVGPIVRPAIRAQTPVTEDFFVVYLKPSYRPQMLRALSRLGIHNVHVFPDRSKNIVDYLSRCKAVISSAGHQFMSEAMVLRKPIFVVPQTGQYEQMLNARMLEDSGWGMWSSMRCVENKLTEFVSALHTFPRPARNAHTVFRFSDDLPLALDRIERFLAETGPQPGAASTRTRQRHGGRAVAAQGYAGINPRFSTSATMRSTISAG